MSLQFASLYDGQEVFLWLNCLLDCGTDSDFLVGNMVFVRDAWYLAVAPHFIGLHSSLKFCCGKGKRGIGEMGEKREKIFSRLLWSP